MKYLYINEKLVHDLKDEGVPSNELKVIGTNYADFNKLAEDTSRGRRKIDYIKFIPREKPKPEKEGFKSKKKYVENFFSSEPQKIFFIFFF